MDLEKALKDSGSERKAAKLLGISRSKFCSLLYKNRGVCPYCRKNEIKNSKSRCEDCLIKAGPKDLEKRKEYNKDYYWENKEKLKEYNKKYQKQNLEKFRASRKKYDQTELGKISAAKRRAKRLSQEDLILCSSDLELLRKYSTVCENCGSPNNLSLDHHIPLSKGGLLELNNVNLLCVPCNSMKKDKLPEDFFEVEVLNKIKRKFQYFNSFKEVLSPKEYKVEKVENAKNLRHFVKRYHYTGSCPGGIFYFGLFYNERLIGVAVFSKPSRQNINVGGDINLLELSRFVTLNDTPKNTESYFLGACLRDLKSSKYIGVVSYADTTEGHSGAIYKATNFELIGITPKNYHYETSDGIRIHKKQVWDRAKLAGIKEAQQATLEGLVKVEELEKLKYFRNFAIIKGGKG